MLYNTKWDEKIETKVDPLSLASLIAWLEQQPANEVYCYLWPGHCLLAKYFKAMGFKRVCMGTTYVTHGDNGEVFYLPYRFDEIASTFPHTFGAALERARLRAR